MIFRKKNKPSLFSTYEAARRASSQAYSSSQLPETIARSTAAYRDRMDEILSQPLTAIVARRLLAYEWCQPRGEFNVLDFGGAAGQHYVEARAYLPPDLDIRWHVVETEEMVAAARCFESDSLKFFITVEEAAESLAPHLVFSSGALQCVPDPLGQLRELMRIQSQYLFLTRLSLCAASPVRYIVGKSKLQDHGPIPDLSLNTVVSYPLTILPVDEFEACLKEHYEIQFTFDESQFFQPNLGNEKALGRGFFCRLKPSRYNDESGT